MNSKSQYDKKSIVVLLHESAKSFQQKNYCIWFMMDYWRRNGYSVRFLFGTKTFVPADLCFVHIDMSLVPDQYLEFANQYPIVVNGRVKDIRKSTISKNTVPRDSRYQGAVIVKSTLNSAGWPERIVESNIGNLLLLKSIKSFGLPRGSILEQKDYKIFNSINDVPDEHFDDSRIIIEKFLPEMDGDLYCVNFFKFLGNEYLFQKLWSTNPVITGSGLVKRETIDPDPDVLALRNALKIDYGKLDYCIHDGRPVLVDVNKTIGLARSRRTPEEIKLIHQRARGIQSFFE